MPFDNKDDFVAAKGITKSSPAFVAHREQAKPLTRKDRKALRDHAVLLQGIESAFGRRKPAGPLP